LNADIYLIKTDTLGDTIWTKTYGDTLYDSGECVQQTQDGGYIITGSFYSFVKGSAEVALIKTNSIGDTVWTKTYGGNFIDMGYSVSQTLDSGYIITGFILNGLPDLYLVKTDSLGDTLWTRTFGGVFNDEGFSVQQTSDGGYYLIKTNSFGDTIWTRIYGDTFWGDAGYSVQQTSDGGYIITGVTWSFGAVNGDIYLIKTDGNGLVVGIEEDGYKLEVPSSSVKLLQNKPNPFHKLTAISYQLRAPSHTVLNIYDITGRLVEILVDEHHEPGVFQVNWDGGNQVSGIYFYRLIAKGSRTSGLDKSSSYTTTRKMILIH
jgi:hypothetical protein